MAALYERYILPRLLRCACGSKPIRYQRKKIVPKATGTVLEVGMGSGENLPYYDPEQVNTIYGLEPSPEMRQLAKPVAKNSGLNVAFIDRPGESIPLPDHSIDTVLLTYTLCTIQDRPAALAQMMRVLKPNGRLLFCEHSLAPDETVARWQKRISPAWAKIAGGCRADIPIVKLILDAGFQLNEDNEMYLPGIPRTLGFNVWGVAQKREKSAAH